MADAREPYAMRPWVLWGSKDPLRAVHGRAGVDAVIVETPYERVRYEAYLQRLQGLPLGVAEIERFRREAEGHLGFVVFGHSRSGETDDRTFLARFTDAQFALGAALIPATQRTTFGPSLDLYDVGTFREERYTGSVTYRFAIAEPGCSGRGTMTFRDADGRPYAFVVDLSHYR